MPPKRERGFNQDDNENVAVAKGPRIEQRETIKCPYLTTINRQLLDFDFEKVCSVSLTNQNVYACLVCGKYFNGRGKTTHAYTHSVQMSHHVFINLDNSKIYCIPDNYEVIDSSLNDIKRALHPCFSDDEIAKIDANTILAHDQYGVAYLPGFVGLNNLRCTDFVNVVLHALAHISPLRNFFLKEENYAHSNSVVVHHFGEMIRKIWSRANFKSTVSPHEFIQAVTIASSRKFRIGEQAEAIEFMSWLLNHLHSDIYGKQKKKKSIIHETFQGMVHVTVLKKKKTSLLDKLKLQEEKERELGNEIGDDTQEVDGENKEDFWEEKKGLTNDEESTEQRIKGWEQSEMNCPFLYLTLDIPSTPLFKDSQGGNIIPQIPLYTVLQKFNNEKWTNEIKHGEQTQKKYKLLKLPQFLVLHLARFTKNNFFVEKNPTIVTCPIKNLELKEYIGQNTDTIPKEEDLFQMSIPQLKALLEKYAISSSNCVEKSELINLARDFITTKLPDILSTKYDLIVNVCHDSPPGQGQEGNVHPLKNGSYRVHVQHKATEQWYEIQDLHVQETMPQLIGLSESYLMIYERKSSSTSSARALAQELYG